MFPSTIKGSKVNEQYPFRKVVLSLESRKLGNNWVHSRRLRKLGWCIYSLMMQYKSNANSVVTYQFTIVISEESKDKHRI